MSQRVQFPQGGIEAAAGYRQYNGMKHPVDSGMLIDRLFEETFWRMITNQNAMSKISRPGMGDTVEFMLPGTARASSIQKNGKIEYDTPDHSKFQLILDRNCGYAVKVDKWDIYQQGAEMMEMIRNYTAQAGQVIEQQIEFEILDGIIMAADGHNTGKNAGCRTGKWDLGEAGTPLKIDPDNILRILTRAASVLDEQNCPRTQRYIVLPNCAMPALMANEKLCRADTSGRGNSYLDDYIRTGFNVAGVEIFFTNYVEPQTDDNGDMVFDIPFGHKDAFAYAQQDFCPAEGPLKDVSNYGEYWRGHIGYGMGAIRPECLGSIHAEIEV